MNEVQLGPFQLETLLGRGAMGEVWRGRHRDQGTAVAVKLITGGSARDQAWQASFRDEVRAAARLDHPEIVLLFDHGVVNADAARASRGHFTAGAPWLVMEHASGGSLAQLQGAVPWSRARSILTAILRGLAHAHARGVVHRDLKPANILVCTPKDLRPGLKLGDFGIAAAAGAETQRTGAMLGTPAYMAPELVGGRWRDHGPWTDLYALGHLAWRLTAGRTPFQHLETMAILRAQIHDAPPPFEPVVPVPAGLGEWIDRLLAKSPRDRYQRAAHALADLVALDRPRPAAFPDLADPTPSASPLLPGVGLGLFGLRPIPIAGRETERDCLWELLREVHDTRRPRLALLRGASGVGKSRLLEHIAERAHELGVADVLRGSCANGGVRDIVVRHLDVGDLAGEELAARLERLGLDPALLADGDLRDGAIRALIGAGRPWVLAIDDVHLRQDAIAVVDALIRDERAPLPVLILLAVDDAALADRPVERAMIERLLTRKGSLSFPLGPLTGTVSLIRDRLGLEPHLAARVEERTAGNPLFATRLVGDWSARGLLEPTPSGFALVDGASPDLPADVLALWTDRVHRTLGDLPWDALEVAAALGNDVDGDEWALACPDADRDALVRRLADARLVEPLGAGLRFEHAMLRGAIEENARRTGRSNAAHAACVAALRGRQGPGIAPRLGRHLLAAGRPDEAAAWLIAGAMEVSRTTGLQQALALVSAAHEALVGAPPADPRRGDLAHIHAWILRNLGYVDHAHALIGVAVVQARTHRWPSLLRLELTRALIGLFRHDPDVGARMRSVLERATEPRLIGEAYAALATEALIRGGPEAGILAENGLAKLLEAGDEIGAAQCMRQLAVIRGATDPAAGRAHLHRALDVFRRHGSRIGMAYCWNGLGELARQADDPEEADDLYSRALHVLEETGDADASSVRVNLGITALVRGSPTDAASAVRPVMRTLEQRGRRMVLAAARLCLCPAAAEEADWESFEAHLRRAIELVVETGALDRDLAWLFSTVAEVADRADRRVLGRVAWRQAARQWRGIGQDDRAEHADASAR